MKRMLSISVDVEYETEVTCIGLTPEQKLLNAMLVRALNDLHSKTPEVFRTAIGWFLTLDRPPLYTEWNGFTYHQVIEELNFSPHSLALIEAAVQRAINDKCMSKRETSRKGPCKLVERKGLSFGEKECSALRIAF